MADPGAFDHDYEGLMEAMEEDGPGSDGGSDAGECLQAGPWCG